MVKNTLIYLFLPVLFSFWGARADFTASVDRTNLGPQDFLILQLNLSDATPQGDPDVSKLTKDFTILGKQRSSSLNIINGVISNHTSWWCTLSPLRQGNLTIPSLTIESSVGPLSSNPIPISVGAPSSSEPAEAPKTDTSLSAAVSNPHPYKSEPFRYTVRLVTSEPLAEVQFAELSLEDALVKICGEPKMRDEVRKGIPHRIIEATYLITPFKAGPLTIPRLKVQGRKIIQDTSDFDSLFPKGDPFEIFKTFEKIAGLGRVHLKPFSLSTPPLSLDIKVPEPGVSPWLPATSLKISETLSQDKAFQVGEPFTRTFTLVGEGVPGTQLPCLKDQQGNSSDLKIYADKPTVEENLKKKTMTSWREETYTLIPQRPGKLTLPAISVAWWNLKENKISYITLPERIIEVAPSATALPAVPPPPQSSIHTPETTPQHQDSPPLTDLRNIWIYILMGILSLTLVGVLIWALKFRRRDVKAEKEISREEPLLPPPPLEPRIPLQDLSFVKTADDLQRFLQAYGQTHWKTSQNSSLEAIFSTVRQHAPHISQDETDELLRALYDALYAEKEVDIEILKKKCHKIISAAQKKSKHAQNKGKPLPNLNPT